MIRWLSAEIRIFSYFHNLVLLFCFFGIGLGCLISHKRIYFIVSFILMIVLAGLLSLGDHLGALSLQNISTYLSVYSDFLIWDGAQRTVWYRDLLFFMFGTALLLFCMSVLAAFFIPFGQLLGKLLNENDRPLNAYGMNLLGSIFGILLFYLISKGSLPPSVWFAVGGICCLPFVLPDKRQFAVALCLLMVCVLLVKEKQSPDNWTVWSPYQKLTVWPLGVQVKDKKVRYGNVIFVNSVGYMLIINYSPNFTRSYPALFPPEKVPYDHYNIPYRFTKYHNDASMLELRRWTPRLEDKLAFLISWRGISVVGSAKYQQIRFAVRINLGCKYRCNFCGSCDRSSRELYKSEMAGYIDDRIIFGATPFAGSQFRDSPRNIFRFACDSQRIAFRRVYVVADFVCRDHFFHFFCWNCRPVRGVRLQLIWCDDRRNGRMPFLPAGCQSSSHRCCFFLSTLFDYPERSSAANEAGRCLNTKGSAAEREGIERDDCAGGYAGVTKPFAGNGTL